MKYLVIFKLEPLSEQQTTKDHVIEADGFDRTDFDVVFWKYNNYTYRNIERSRNNVALYRLDHIVCVAEMR